MILDALLFNEIEPAGKTLLKKAGLFTHPKNMQEMNSFLIQINKSIANNQFDGILIGNIFYSFVSSLEVRDRHTTARTFEDIFSALFGIAATDTLHRKNPRVPESIINLDKFNSLNDDWSISSDLSGNKREKADTMIGDYAISLKTLRGFAYDENDKLMPKTIIMPNGDSIVNNFNPELNVGSLSYRALLKGILPDNELKLLGDRKAGLGSGAAIRKNVLDKIKLYNKTSLFKNRLKLFMNYVYDEDLYIVLKSNYKLTRYLIPSDSFIKCIIYTYEKDESFFEKIWYRWENNNLRMHRQPIIDKLEEYNLSYKKIDMKLGPAVNSPLIENFKNFISKQIYSEITKLLDNYVDNIPKSKN